MQIQSTPDLAITLDRYEPGSICQAPKEMPLPDHKAFRNVFAVFITDAMAAQSI